MAHATAAELIADVRALGLLEPAQLDLAVQLSDQQSDSKTLARILAERRLLTPFQANLLLGGHGPELALGSYVVLARVGEGGMGQVFKARHRRLGHVVALKVLRRDRLTNPAAVKRFEREVSAACQVEHPNIVRAFDAGVADGKMFLAMEYVEGIELDRLVKDQGPLQVAEACEYVRQTASGLAACHARGLIHRDVKPKNLLLTYQVGDDGRRTPLVKILDLGLARVDAARTEPGMPRLTQLGKVIGTADYMPPEQARDSHQVDARADLYSLGCTLYYLLAGKPPFSGESKIEKIVSHQLEEAPPLERVRPDVTGELAVVVQKLMAKHPDDRYQTAAEVIEALEPFVAVEVAVQEVALPAPPAEELPAAALEPAPLIVAVRPRPRARGTSRRVVLIATAASGIAFAGLLLGLLAWGQSEPDQTPARHVESPPLSIPAAREPVASRVEPAGIPADRKPLRGPPELAAVVGETRLRHWAPVQCVAVSPDSRLLASGGHDDTVRVWDAATGEERAAFRLHGNGVAAVAFCADGRLRAVAFAAGKPPDLQEWDPASGQVQSYPISGLAGGDAVELAPDGRTLAVVSLKRDAVGTAGGVTLWDVALKEKRAELEEKAPIGTLAWSRDGMTLATAAGKSITAWDVGSKRAQATWPAHEAAVTCLAVAADGSRIASAGTQWSRASGGEVRVWDAATGNQVASLRTREPVAALAFHPQGDVLAIGTGQAEVGRIELHGLVSGGNPRILAGHGGPVTCLAFSADGRSLASGSSDHTVRTWDVASGKELNPLRRQHGSATGVAFAPDGLSLAVLTG
ncbi:MAG TPA: serine/threonine-protein kinase, partial [Gemmataceae bacterium]|nr:serine/threonine-protein kinase [Gemmataceae bacterium]